MWHQPCNKPNISVSTPLRWIFKTRTHIHTHTQMARNGKKKPLVKIMFPFFSSSFLTGDKSCDGERKGDNFRLVQPPLLSHMSIRNTTKLYLYNRTCTSVTPQSCTFTTEVSLAFKQMELMKIEKISLSLSLSLSLS